MHKWPLWPSWQKKGTVTSNPPPAIEFHRLTAGWERGGWPPSGPPSRCGRAALALVGSRRGSSSASGHRRPCSSCPWPGRPGRMSQCLCLDDTRRRVQRGQRAAEFVGTSIWVIQPRNRRSKQQVFNLWNNDRNGLSWSYLSPFKKALFVLLQVFQNWRWWYSCYLMSVTPLNEVASYSTAALSCHFPHNRSCSVRSLWWRHLIRLFTQQIMIEGYPTSCQLKRCSLIYRVDNAAFWSLEGAGVSRSLGASPTRFHDDSVL